MKKIKAFAWTAFKALCCIPSIVIGSLSLLAAMGTNHSPHFLVRVGMALLLASIAFFSFSTVVLIFKGKAAWCELFTGSEVQNPAL